MYDTFVEDGRFVREGEVIFSYTQIEPDPESITVNINSSNAGSGGTNLSQMLISSDLEGETYEVITAVGNNSTVAANEVILELEDSNGAKTYIKSDSAGEFKYSDTQIYTTGDFITIGADTADLSTDNNSLYKDLVTTTSAMTVPSDLTGYYISSVNKVDGDLVNKGNLILTLISFLCSFRFGSLRYTVLIPKRTERRGKKTKR